MIDEETRLTVKIGPIVYNLSAWQRYRCHLGGGQIYPDIIRLSEHFTFEVIVGLVLKIKDYSKYKENPQSCIWKVYTEDVNNDLKFITEWYQSAYGTLEVPYNQIGLATKRIDDFILKYNKLTAFT